MTAPLACETPATGAAAALAGQLQSRLPEIETARLCLRAPRIGDFAAYAEIALGPRGAHVQSAGTRDEAWRDFAQMVAGWVLRGHGLWTAEMRDDATIAGFVLLGFEPGDDEPELGFMFRDCAEGKGLAFEAAAAARRHGFAALGLAAMVSTIDPDNTRSIALAERLGAVRDPQAEAAFEGAVLVYRHPHPEGL